MSRRVLLSLRLAPQWASLDTLRAAVERLFDGDAPRAERFLVVATELVENALKYGEWGGGGEVEVAVVDDDGRVAVEVANPSTPQRTEALAEWLDEIARTGSPSEAYRRRIGALFGGGGRKTSGSGMGLLRVVHEAACGITTSFQGGSLLVRATERA